MADLHLRNPQISPPKKEAVEYRRASGLAPIHAMIPPNHANAGRCQKKTTSAKTAHPVETLLCYNIAWPIERSFDTNNTQKYQLTLSDTVVLLLEFYEL